MPANAGLLTDLGTYNTFTLDDNVGQLLLNSLVSWDVQMIQGIFSERPTDRHIPYREAMLASGIVLPAPRSSSMSAAEGFSADDSSTMLNLLRDTGLAVIDLGEPLTSDDFLRLGAFLGTAMPETDATVAPFVERGVILNIRSEFASTDDVSVQPFATNFLTLHTEGSGRPAPQQPRYIVLMCCEPGASTAAQTVLVQQQRVESKLSSADIDVLSRTRYTNSPDQPSIVRNTNGRNVFAFRDFLRQELAWTHSSPDASECDHNANQGTSDRLFGENRADSPDPVSTINDTIGNLLAAMYAPGEATGIHWKRGLIVVIDNSRFFHGKSSAVSPELAGRRHLKRLRII